jgi:hypothetical protein
MSLCSRAAVGAALLLFGAAGAHAQQVAPPSPATVNGLPAAVQAGQASPPRCDVNCVRENAPKAAEACAPRIEAQAPTDFDWISRPNSGIFQQADKASPTDSIVRYRGDSVRFMTADKSWVRVSYECGYDVSKQAVSYAQVRSGRLDQPLAPVAPATRSVVSNAAPPAMASATGSPGPGPMAARPARPHVGEPSPIQQQSANPRPR